MVQVPSRMQGRRTATGSWTGNLPCSKSRGDRMELRRALSFSAKLVAWTVAARNDVRLLPKAYQLVTMGVTTVLHLCATCRKANSSLMRERSASRVGPGFSMQGPARRALPLAFRGSPPMLRPPTYPVRQPRTVAGEETRAS